MKIHTEIALTAYKKWDLIRYIVKLEKKIKNAKEKLDNISSSEVRAAVKVLTNDIDIRRD